MTSVNPRFGVLRSMSEAAKRALSKPQPRTDRPRMRLDPEERLFS